LFEDLNDVWEGFWILHKARGAGYTGPEPLKISEILSYACCIGYNDNKQFIKYIQTLDTEFFVYVNSKRNKGTSK